LELQLYNPHPKQAEIHRALNSLACKYYTVPIGRQFGKSLLGINQNYLWGINNADIQMGWVSPVYSQAKKVFREMEKGIIDTPFLRSSNKSDLIITFGNRSTLQFFSAEAYDAIRGNTFHYLTCDEFDYFKSEAWDEVLKATVIVKGRKVLFLSTPKGKGLMFRMANMSNVDPNYHTIKGTSFDNPLIPVSELEDARRNLPEHIFKQEYLAEFLDDSSSVFKEVKACIKNNPPFTLETFAGVDLGRADDYTVVTVLNSVGQVIHIERWRHLEWSEIINNVVDVLNKYKPRTIIEANNAQDAIYEQIRNKIVFNKSWLEPFVTGQKNKQNIIEDLIVAFEQRDIGITSEQWLIDELNMYTYDYNLKTRQIKYSAPQGFHDDGVMSLAFAWAAYRNLKGMGKMIVL
jgi:hypothetical protein